MNTYNIRRAMKEDFEAVFPLICMAIEDLANQFTATSDPEIVKERMWHLYQTSETRFSLEYCLVVETLVGNKPYVAAAGFAYSGRQIDELTRKTIGVCQFIGATYDRATIARILKEKEAKFDEYYIDNLAVYKDFRGQGLARKLIDAFEEQARTAGFAKVSILADVLNQKAHKVYENLGYRTDAIFHVLGHDYYHLVKNVHQVMV